MDHSSHHVIDEKYKGILCIVVSAFFFALMNLFVRMSGDLPFIQKSFFRNFVAVIFALIVLVRHKDSFAVKKGHWKYLLLRSAFGTIGILCNFYAVDHLLLADASMLNKMSPFFAILFSALILKEKITPFQGVALAGAFIGSLFVVKPTVVGMDIFPALIGLFGGVCAGAAYTMVRKMGELGIKGPFIVFFFSAFSCVTTLPVLILQYQPMTRMQLFLLLMAGLTAAGGQFAITAAYCFAPAREISVYDYSQILFAAILGFIVFGQVPDALSWLGYLIIIGMAVLMFLYNVKGWFRKKEKARI